MKGKCWSDVGRNIESGPQDVYFGIKCDNWDFTKNVATVVHELMHVLGN